MGTIKMFVTLRARPHVSKDYFHDRWRHPYGTWGRGLINIRSYVQSHGMETHLLRRQHEAVDGVAEIGLESLDDVAGLTRDPVYLELIKQEEVNIFENTGLCFADETVLQSGPDRPGNPLARIWHESEQPVTVKLIQLVRGMAAADWFRDDDLALGRAVGALRHVRASPHPLFEPSADREAMTGIRQLWWPTRSEFEAGVARAPEAWRELIDREPRAFSGLFQAERFF